MTPIHFQELAVYRQLTANLCTERICIVFIGEHWGSYEMAFSIFAKYDYCFLLDVIIAIIAIFSQNSDNRYFVIIAKFFAHE